MKRFGLLFLLGAAAVAQLGCDDLGFDVIYQAVPGYERYGSEVYYERPSVEEYWIEETYYEETYYEESWYDDWYVLPW